MNTNFNNSNNNDNNVITSPSKNFKNIFAKKIKTPEKEKEKINLETTTTTNSGPIISLEHPNSTVKFSCDNIVSQNNKTFSIKNAAQVTINVANSIQNDSNQNLMDINTENINLNVGAITGTNTGMNVSARTGKANIDSIELPNARYFSVR